jgi:hypothetical protein
MFISNININFARKKGSKDKRNTRYAKLGLGAVGGGIGGYLLAKRLLDNKKK